MSEWDNQYYEEEQDGLGHDNGACCECSGSGWKVVCIDDMCHGEDECIHGDPPVPCRNCNPNGEKEDSC